MKKIFILAIAFICSITLLFSQTVVTGGKTFQTVKKTNLNTTTEYYLLKEKTGTTPKTESFIKTNGKYYKTVFTEAEMKSFLTKGTVSSLGKIEKIILKNNKSIDIVKKGKTSIVIHSVNGQLKVIEYGGDLNSEKKNDGDITSPEGQRCTRKCFEDWEFCMNLEIEGANSSQEAVKCIFDEFDCNKRCDKNFENRANTSYYVINTGSLAIKFE